MVWVIWSVLLGGTALIWASRHWAISQAKREQIPLTSHSYPGPPANPPTVSVLIAAKDEQANIATAVETMLAQDYPNFELIVINDRSSDRTPEILEELKARYPEKLRVIHIDNLEDGWFGKNNAMREGVAIARGEWLCFGDADCRQISERTLSMAVRHAVDWNIDFLSVLPLLETHSLWERIIQPVCGAIMVLWFNPKLVNDPDNSAAYANGAFMLMTRRCYEAIGGHEAVRSQVNEDMHMARLAKEKGQRLVVVQGEDLYTVRMYSKLSEIWRGWTRIFYGCFGTFRRLRVTLMLLMASNLFPYASFIIAAAVLIAKGWSAAGPGWQAVGLLSAIVILLQQTVIARFYRLSHANPWLAPTFMLGALFCMGMLVNAMLKLGGRTTVSWRGATYRGDTVVQK
ncbi:MAG: glycosyltransferase [Phycisphaerae bacterium]|nr:glycosyltransferase [Phycisphaerae bacterium]